jgi:hypothetical protein
VSSLLGGLSVRQVGLLLNIDKTDCLRRFWAKVSIEGVLGFLC